MIYKLISILQPDFIREWRTRPLTTTPGTTTLTFEGHIQDDITGALKLRDLFPGESFITTDTLYPREGNATPVTVIILPQDENLYARIQALREADILGPEARLY